ncbi:hypothetical protein EU527_04965 [Candidatus Thorarchaeota archaeon]|nr:MAG: hypothetical protein EU527_04965 [Candidatus Thorarchaeota archaeon]
MKTFIVDAMLGKLATWLRLTGQDTIYSTKMHDDEILRIAKEQERVILTSDAILARRGRDMDIEVMLVRGSVDEEVASVFVRYGILPEADPSISRCTKCNGELTPISYDEKEQIRPFVFEKTFNYYDKFWFCKYCKTVFFRGGQWKNIDEYMVRISELMKEIET